jgi:hypothetical protein
MFLQCKQYITFFFTRPSYRRKCSHTRGHTHPTNAHTHTIPLWAPPKNWIGPANLEIDKVTTNASLSTGPGWADSTTRNLTSWASLSLPIFTYLLVVSTFLYNNLKLEAKIESLSCRTPVWPVLPFSRIVLSFLFNVQTFLHCKAFLFHTCR